MIRKWFAGLDRRYARPCLYVAVTALITFCIGIALWNATGLVATIWDYICLIMQPMVYGAILCYLLQPVVQFFSRLLTRKESLAENERSRTHLAIILTIVSFAIILALIVVFALIVAARSIGGVSLANLQNLLSSAQFNLQDFLATMQNRLEVLGVVAPNANGMANPIELIDDIGELFTLVMLSGVFGIYFLFDSERASSFFYRLLRATAGDRTARQVDEFLHDADRVFSGFVRGQFIDAIAVGILMTLALTLVGIPYAPFVGIIVGVANIIPYAGGPVGYVLVVLVCYTEQTMSKIIIGAIAVTVVMFIDGNFIGQRLLAKTLTFHPMLVLVALVVGSTIGGLAGMLVAVPLFAFLKQRLDQWLDRRIAKMDAQRALEGARDQHAVTRSELAEEQGEDARPSEGAEEPPASAEAAKGSGH